MPNRTTSVFRVPEVNGDVSEEESDEDGYDGEESVTTDTSETNSSESLTSVD